MNDVILICESRPFKIKMGDSVCSIAREMDIPIDNILKINKHRNPRQLSVGDTLCIPER